LNGDQPSTFQSIASWKLISSPARNFLLLALVAGCLFFVGLGHWPLLEPDEGRNAEVAREMLVTGDWIIPHYDALPYLDKPAVFFCLVAASFRWAGISEASARLPSALAALGTVLLTWLLGRRMFGESAGVRAGIILATSPLVIIFSRQVIFDMTLTFLVTLAMVCFWLSMEADFRRPWLEALAFISMGVATITKGPVGFLLPLLSIFVFQLSRRRLGELKRHGWGRGIPLFLAFVLPWFIAVSFRYPDFPRYALWEESLERFATARAQRSGGVLYYVPVYLAGFFPWSLFLLFAGWHRLRRWRELPKDAGKRILFLLAWAVLIFAFFTVSRSKLPGYFLPATVPLSILTAQAWAETGSQEGSHRADWLTGGFAAQIAIGLLVAAAAWAIFGGFRWPSVEARVAQRVPPAVIPLLKPTLLYSGLILVGLGVLGRNIAARLRGAVLTLASLALAATTTPFLIARWTGPLDLYARENSSRKLARTILASPEKDLPLYGYYYFRTGLPFYLQRPVGLVTTDGGELTSNYIGLLWRRRQSRPMRPEEARGEEVRSGRGPAVLTDLGPSLVIDGRGFVQQAISSSRPTLVLLKNYNIGGLTGAFGPGQSPLPLWTEWQDAVWEVPAGKD